MCKVISLGPLAARLVYSVLIESKVGSQNSITVESPSKAISPAISLIEKAEQLFERAENGMESHDQCG